jgi:hypothetical protein
MDEQLTGIERSILQKIIIRFGQDPFTSEALEAAFPTVMTGHEIERGIILLRNRKLIETRKKAWGEIFHLLAYGQFVKLQHYFFGPQLLECIIPEQCVTPIIDRRRGFPKLLFFFLAVATYPGLTLSQKGGFHKKDVVKLERRLDVSDSDVDGLQMQYLHQDKMNRPVAIIFDAALRLGLVRQGFQRLDVLQDNVKSWLQQSEARMMDRLFTLWVDTYSPSDVFLQHVGAVLTNLPPSQWLSIRKLVQVLSDAGVIRSQQSESDTLRAVIDYWVRPMIAFGFFETGTCEVTNQMEASEELVIRRTDYGFDQEDSPSWMIQPNFEVLVPPSMPYTARWLLESCAQFVTGDTIDTYLITRKDWERALENGQDCERLIDDLQQYNETSVPESIAWVLREWSDHHGSITIEEVTLIRCKNVLLATQLRVDSQFAQFAPQEMGPCDFIIPKQQLHAATAWLIKQGYAPFSVKQTEHLSNDHTAHDHTLGIIHTQRNGMLFPLDDDPPGMQQLREQFEGVPQAWTQHLRKYHPSTMRELLTTAIKLRTAVKVSNNHEQWLFIPKRVLVNGAEWIVHGYAFGHDSQLSSNETVDLQIIVFEDD